MSIPKKIAAAVALVLFCLPSALRAQESATVYGRILDASNEQPVELVTIYVKGGKSSVSSDEQGNFAIQVPANERLSLVFRRVAFKESSTDILPLPAGARFALDVRMAPNESNLEVIISERRLDDAGKHFPLANCAVSPQCGFASTVDGNDIDYANQEAKLRLVVDLARSVWGTA